MTLRRPTTIHALCAIVLVSTLAALPARAALISKSFEFKDGVKLEIGSTTESGLRLDSVQFMLPPTKGQRFLRTGGLVQAEVTVSNIGDRSRRIGIAIALYDANGRLVGVASGGNRLAPLKKNRQQSFRLSFDDVNSLAHRAETFQISVESKP